MTAPIRIQKVSTPQDVETFIRFPFRLYQEASHWVPPLLMERRDFLNPERNPVFEYAKIQPFLAFRGHEPVGTLAAVLNERYGQYHPEEQHVGFFGLYECIEDQAVSEALFAAAEAWLSEGGKRVMRGPVNLTTNDVVGLLIDGFHDDPTVMMPYNPPYYAQQFEAAGFAKAKDLYAFSHGKGEYSGQFHRVSAKLQQRSRFKIRPVDMGRWHEELEFVRQCYNTSWAGNWGFVPWTDRELAFLAKELKPLIDPRLALVGEVDGKPVGFMISIPDANEALKLAKGKLFPLGLLKMLWKIKVQKCSRLRTIAMGILPEYQRRGFDAFLVHQSIHNAMELGYSGSEMGWILEDNEPMLAALRKLGSRQTKTYRVYDRRIGASNV